MKHKSIFFLSILFALWSCQTQQLADGFSYHVTPNFNEGTIQVDFERNADHKGNLIIIYENESMGERDLFNCLVDFKVTPEPKNISFKKKESTIQITGIPSEKYKVEYKIRKDYNHAPLNRVRYRPIVDSTYFHVLGTKLFAYPSDLFYHQDSLVNININWKFKNSEAVFHSSFGSDRKQELLISQDQLHNSFFVGGDFERYTFQYKGQPVHLVTRGKKGKVSNKEVFQILKETISNQHAFWKEDLEDPFSVSLIPTYEKRSYSVGGSALTNSFISYTSNNAGSTVKRLTWLYNHELMHKWIGRTIQIEKDVLHYWFSEGFTEYFAYKVMLKNNIISLDEYIAVINNENLKSHGLDKVANTPNHQLTFNNYWSNYGTFGKLPYRRGFLYAFYLDYLIKKQSDFKFSLDDFMFDLIKLAKENKDFRINHETFKDYLSNYLSTDQIDIDFTNYIENGDFIDFKNHLFEGLQMIDHGNFKSLEIEENKRTELINQLKK